MQLPELHAAVPATEAHDVIAPDALLPDRDEPRQESLFPDEGEPDVVDWDAEPREEEPPPLTLAQAEALVRHELGRPPS